MKGAANNLFQAIVSRIGVAHIGVRFHHFGMSSSSTRIAIKFSAHLQFLNQVPLVIFYINIAF